MKKDSYLHINNTKSCMKKRSSANSTFPLSEMKQLVGEEGQDSWIECVYHQFTNRNIVIICDEEFLLKEYTHPTIITRCGITIKGCCVVAGIIDVDDGRDIGYLSEEECLEAWAQLNIAFP